MPVDIATCAVIAVLFLATLVRSTFGFGDALVGMPLLAFAISLPTAAPLVALVSIVVSATIIVRDWRIVHFGNARSLVLSSCCGIPLGLYALAHVPEHIVKFLLGLLVVMFALYGLYRPTGLTLKSDRSIYCFGFASGVLGGAYNTHGPPLIIYGTLRNWPADRFRATLQGYFLPTSLLIVLSHGIAGSLVPEVLWLFAYSLPAVLLAVFIGHRLNRHLHTRDFRKYIYMALILIGTVLLVKSIV